VQLDSTQLAAVTRACTTPFSIITGGAGTGKTTIIKAITDRLEAKGETVALAAFAGKAAARVREACGHPASTIHRLLGFQGSAFTTPDLRGVSLIVDEASMVDSSLLSEITKRNPKRLVLVGDPAQLPPVGRAQPFHDIIALRPDLVSTLTRCYRATEAVYISATAIRNGTRPSLEARSDGEKWIMRNTGTPAQTQQTILDWIAQDVFDFQKDIILVARNGDTPDEPCTVRGLNRAVVDMISPRDEKTKFVVGDRVINTKNLPELDCWNGTTGTVHAIDQDGGIWVHTDIPVIDKGKTRNEREPVYTEHVLFGRDVRINLQLAYALTVHKAQGSQYRRVCVALFNKDLHSILDRSLLYTAVTRTKNDCVVIGELSATWAAVEKQNHKSTILQVLGAK
jgi:exodeoxyribonuclease V alpha subunit